mmetsp:Transcript_20868/g.23840  ORF Transcript_20868/g.23840 Transcript_20868/m.23840 type:complete len:313 (+) Transcript_20868:55-993(+)|eukprot:CAMPEP_0194131340 /NCGR_PEP_ID=MMETSP0152-20130528/2139_1 /TAXON_ID=1049557 /ORGANISM="Thalassiothrix antarctica, Strain L6-D1" /LENGTH=312 /DNA_ID=CAMNT_0038826097 /DNA_START=5 /DNA_END=943 /DNA_ORIENTATION=+
MSIGSGKIPLIQALPWFSPGSSSNRVETENFILVTDSVDTDGRFLLYAQACQTLLLFQKVKQAVDMESSPSVLWLSCGVLNESLVASSLRRMGCEAASNYIREPKDTHLWKGPLSIHSIMTELAKEEQDTSDGRNETYFKNLYKRIKSWSAEFCNMAVILPLIVIDDASALGNMFGERLTYFFLSYVRSIPRTNIIVRCSNDIDKEIFVEQDLPAVHPSRKVDWFGAGGERRESHQLSPCKAIWERTLIELANWVVDVVPLASGYSKEAHGRIIVSAIPSSEPSLVMNYCLHDTSVSAIRLKESNKRGNEII